MINTLSRIIQIKSTSSLISSFMNTYKINLYFTVKNLYKKSSPEVFSPKRKVLMLKLCLEREKER